MQIAEFRKLVRNYELKTKNCMVFKLKFKKKIGLYLFEKGSIVYYDSTSASFSSPQIGYVIPNIKHTDVDYIGQMNTQLLWDICFRCGTVKEIEE